MRPPFLFVALSAVLLCGCYSAGDGVSPPLKSLYFPTGLALDATPNLDGTQGTASHLFVASSDFDLQYKSSALASYDLASFGQPPQGIAAQGMPSVAAPLAPLVPMSCNVTADCASVPGLVCDNDILSSPPPSYFCVDGVQRDLKDVHDACNGRGFNLAADQLLYPGLCRPIDTRIETQILTDEVEIGAFATDIIYTPNGSPDDAQKHPGRLFLPVRGDATLHWIEVQSDGHMDCNANTLDKTCDDAHRVGNDEYTESPNLLRQEPEPFGIAIDDSGRYIAITNQTTGSVSLYVNQWSSPPVPPQLEYQLSGLPTAPVGIVALPSPRPVDPNHEPGFLTVYRNAAQVDLLRVHDEDPAAGVSDSGYPIRVLTRAASVGINANSNGTDSRGIVIDDAQRRADYAACDLQCPNPDTRDTCEQGIAACFQAAHQANVFVSNRAPASLLVGALTPDFSYASGTSELPAFTDSVPLSTGPSRIVFGRVKVASKSGPNSDVQGPYALEPRVFIVCFDARRIYIYDPVRHVIDSIVTTGRGPFALAIDEQRGLGYVAHFTDSYLGVISLDQRFPQNYAAFVASVGVPSPPRASK